MTAATRTETKRWWQDPRWIAAGLAVLCVVWLLWGLFGPEPPITVSPATTYLTAPLAADGLPDYGAALLAAQGPAPKPEDNAAVELLQVMWPMDFDPPDLPLVCRALGIPHVPPADVLQEPYRNAATKVTLDMYDAAVKRPWTGAEFPALEAWVVAHEAALDRLVAAADRPCCWLPSPDLLGPGPQRLASTRLCDGTAVRGMVRLLLCRAMWHSAAGRHVAAWRDIRAIHRLGRLLAAPKNAPQFTLAQILACSLSACADAALTRRLLGMADLPADLLAEIRRDLDALGPLPDPVDVVASERLMYVDTLVWLARRSPGGRSGRAGVLADVFGAASDPLGMARPAVVTSLDWNLALGRTNARFDALTAATRQPTFSARQAAIERLEREVSQRFDVKSRWAAAGRDCTMIGSRTCRSVFIADYLLASFTRVASDAFREADVARASGDLTRTAAALAAWKADRAAGEAPYPETLSALVPRYLPAEPLDPFTDKPFIYERRGDGYLLASVGENGVYDGGDDRKGWIIGGEWQAIEQNVDPDKWDLVVRMPVPPVPASAPAP